VRALVNRNALDQKKICSHEQQDVQNELGLSGGSVSRILLQDSSIDAHSIGVSFEYYCRVPA
jgi:hypothetical protein